MVNPWNGPRHRSWASNSVVTAIVLGVLLATTLAVDYFGEPPTYLTGLLGTAAGAFFTALGSDKAKRDAEVARAVSDAQTTAHRAEDRAAGLEQRAGESEQRETERSRHRDDDVGGGAP